MNLKKIFLIVAVVAGIVGCGPKGVSDQALMTDIQAKLYADATAKTANVKVNVSNGVVTLTGDAPSADVALEVGNIANATPGTKSVINQVQVVAGAVTPMAPPAGTPAPPPAMAQNAPPLRHEGDRDHGDRERDRDKHEPLPVVPAAPTTATVPAGTDIGVQMIDGISSKTNTSGQTFRASLSSPIVVNGQVVIPSGAGATVLLSSAKGAGRIKGNSALEVRLVSIQQGGQSYDVNTSVHDEVGKGRGKQTAVRSGIGAAAGAVIGALAGGGKGAAIGSLAGGGAGAGFQLATHGEQVTIPSESRISFSLTSPFVVTLR